MSTSTPHDRPERHTRLLGSCVDCPADRPPTALHQRVTRLSVFYKRGLHPGPVGESLPACHLPVTSEHALQRDRRSRRQGCADRGRSRERASSRVGPGLWPLSVNTAVRGAALAARLTPERGRFALTPAPREPVSDQRGRTPGRLSALFHMLGPGSSLRRRVSDAPHLLRPLPPPPCARLRASPSRKQQGPSQQTPARV